MSNPENEGGLEELLDYLKRARGLDLTSYKRSSLGRRVHRRMYDVGAKTYEDYQDYLEVHPNEFEFLFNTVLINVTTFFRDQEAWRHLENKILPQVLNAKSPYVPIRAWSAGCASGEEAYSLAILLAEALGVEECRKRVKIYATDVDTEALEVARQAVYSDEAMKWVPEELRDRYFEISSGRYVFRNDLRRTVIFGRHDLLHDAPISRLDLLVCRNTLIYFNRDAQRRIIARFHFALQETGYLFLGKAEMLLSHADLFRTENVKYRIFSKVSRKVQHERMMILAEAAGDISDDELDTYAHLQEAAFNLAPAAHVVVDSGGRLAMANKQAVALFGLATQDIGQPFQDLRLSYQPIELRSLLEQARRERTTINVDDVVHQTPIGKKNLLDVHITPLGQGGGRMLGTSIVFEDVTQRQSLQRELETARQESETTHEELQSTNEELETSNEELQATVEELQTTNEELQSTNEEIETVNEELQSTNEELQTMNEELHERTVDLNRANAFLQSILASVDVGIVVVDDDFQIELWNHRAEDMWGLRADEVVGRSLLNLDIGLPVAELKDPILRFMKDSADGDQISLEATNRRGQKIACIINNSLHYDVDGNMQGVVLLMEERPE